MGTKCSGCSEVDAELAQSSHVAPNIWGSPGHRRTFWAPPNPVKDHFHQHFAFVTSKIWSFSPQRKNRFISIIVVNENLFTKGVPAEWKCWRFHRFTYKNHQMAKTTKLWKRSGCLGNNFSRVSISVLQLIFSFSQAEKYHCRGMLPTNKQMHWSYK